MNRCDAEICLVMSNKPEVEGLAKAKRAGIPTKVDLNGHWHLPYFNSHETFMLWMIIWYKIMGNESRWEATY